MKKILLAGTALVGVAVLPTLAHADLKLDLGGYFRGYMVYSDNDEITGTSLHNFDFRRDTEVHFTGETTTDSGLTVGVHQELKMGSEANNGGVTTQFGGFNNSGALGDADPSQTDESYIYFSGGWGRVNFGSEDGAAYLLQVAAPSADSNVDGLRVYVQAFDPSTWIGAPAGALPNTSLEVLGYDNADFRNTDKLTYLTPKWNGFQGGVSYAPETGQDEIYGSTFAASIDNQNATFDNLWEVAARWDGEFEGFGISAGAGYSHASNETNAGVGNFASDDLTTWDAGLNFTYQDFSLGGAYKRSNTGTTGPKTDAHVWVVGGAWDNGPYHVGVSYYDNELDQNAYGLGLVGDGSLERWTVGGGYTYGPGMTFRGSVAFLNVDNGATGVPDPNQTQVAIGTDVNF